MNNPAPAENESDWKTQLPESLTICFDWDMILRAERNGDFYFIEPEDLPISTGHIREFNRLYRAFSDLMFTDSYEYRHHPMAEKLDWDLFHSDVISLWRKVFQELQGIGVISLYSDRYHTVFSDPDEYDRFVRAD